MSFMIEVEDVSLRYLITQDKIISIKEFLIAFLKGKIVYKDFWALKKVNIKIKKGEVVGIVGHNGAGKSTFLKLISGIMKPTEGKIKCNGNVVPMLELGSGFDYDLTGRENIFLNGAILGYGERFLKDREKEIIEFSELGEFIDVPLRNYSSGMLVRLAFSIATIVSPDILIVDEILAVGDEDFQRKSRNRMMELMGGGTTVLFVSHNINQIRELCDRVMWIEHGEVQMIGKKEKVCSEYENYRK